MPKIFQEFHLAEEEMGMIDPEKMKKLISSDTGEKLIQELKAKGYEVLCIFEDKDVVDGIPVSLIVGAEFFSSIDLKTGFFKAAESLGIKWFKSGRRYSDLF